jgi:hypothetical protein
LVHEGNAIVTADDRVDERRYLECAVIRTQCPVGERAQRLLRGLAQLDRVAEGPVGGQAAWIGRVKVKPEPGAVLVWAAGAKGSDQSAGHIAIIKSAAFDNSLGKWVITVRHSDWGSNCNPPSNTTFKWANLDGVKAYVRQGNLAATNSSGMTTRKVIAGDNVIVSASGTWCMGGSGPSAECGNADGIRSANPDESGIVLPGAKLGQLIGRIGSGQWFALGVKKQFTASATGVLTLMFNDLGCCYSDNSRSISVTVRAWP